MKSSFLHSILLIELAHLSSQATAEGFLRASRQLDELPSLPDGSLCDFETTCSQCENGHIYYLDEDDQQRHICGGEKADGTICSVDDNTCRLCENGYYADYLADEYKCGSEPRDVADGELCSIDTTCSRCENGYTSYFEGDEQQYLCGRERADGMICSVNDNTCRLCENGYYADHLADAYKCGTELADGELCSIDTTCSQCENGYSYYFDELNRQQYICGRERADGTLCSVNDNTCRLCENGYSYDALADQNFCGSYLELADGSLCDRDGTCLRCENGYTFYSKGDEQQYICGRGRADGAICSVEDNTCRLCENGHSYDDVANENVCGSQVALADGSLCDEHSTCSRCANGYIFYLEGDQQQYICGIERSDGTICRLNDNTCQLCENGYYLDYLADEHRCGSRQESEADPIRVCVNFGSVSDNRAAWSIKEVGYPHSIIAQGNPTRGPSAVESDGCYAVHGTLIGVTYELRMIDRSDSGTVNGVVINNGQTLAEIHNVGPDQVSRAPFQV